jgi:uncharacterized protein YheU (UPF0270 family)
MPDNNREKPILISFDKLSREALDGIIESFILREGTDYGPVEITYESKAQQIHRQIEKGEIKIVFDQSTDTVSLLTAHDVARIL